MKKELVIFSLISLILLSNFVVADSNDTTSNTPDSDDIKQELEIATKNIDEKVSKGLEKEIQIPQYLQVIAKIMFGMEETIGISLFIILVILWLIVLILLIDIIKFIPIPLLQNFWPRAIVGILISSLIALSGITKSIALFFLNIGDSLKFLEKWGAGALLFALVVLGIILFAIMKIMPFLDRYYQKLKVAQDARDAGLTLGFAGAMRDLTRKK